MLVPDVYPVIDLRKVLGLPVYYCYLVKGTWAILWFDGYQWRAMVRIKSSRTYHLYGSGDIAGSIYSIRQMFYHGE